MNDKRFIKAKIVNSLKKFIEKKYLSSYELSRLTNLATMVSAILVTGKTELQKMALGDANAVKHSSKVKNFKRFLMNEHINMESYFLPFVAPLLSNSAASGELVFSIDGSVVGNGCMALMFSVIYKDKAIPVVWHVYKAKKGHLLQKAHRLLLAALAQTVPGHCRVIITGDGKFDGCEWQQDILGHGWDYVLRTGKNVNISEDSWDDFKAGHVCLQQGQELFFEHIGFTAKKLKTNPFIWHGKGHQSPLYLVTNLDFGLEIKRFYKKRFKIEPFFRDQKSHGFHIQKSGLSDPKRLARLLIASCLAYVLAIMGGIKALKSKFYDKIARMDGEYLSLFQLGYRFLLYLVDLRQWRSFSWKTDFMPAQPVTYNYVPF